jgi:hypothetical protein
VHISNPATGDAVHHEFSTDYHANRVGFCETPSPLRFGDNPGLPRLIYNDTISVFVDIHESRKAATTIDWASIDHQPSSAGGASLQKPNREQFGIVGLSDTGGSSSLNSTLQVLFHCPAFRRLIFDIDARADGRSNVLLNLQILFHDMQLSGWDCSPIAIVNSIGRDQGRDATEIWGFLVDNIRDKLPPALRGRLDALFFTSSVLYMRNDEVGVPDTTAESFSLLTVSITGCRTIQEAVQGFFAEQAVDDYEIEGVGARRIQIRHEVTRAPEVLALQLTRYEADIRTFELRKLTNVVEVGESLHLPVGAGVVRYSLHGVFMHSGDYFAYVRPTVERRWFSISDTAISSVAPSDVLRDASRDGYFFVYGRQDTEEANYGAVAEDEVPDRVRALAHPTK